MHIVDECCTQPSDALVIMNVLPTLRACSSRCETTRSKESNCSRTCRVSADEASGWLLEGRASRGGRARLRRYGPMLSLQHLQMCRAEQGIIPIEYDHRLSRFWPVFRGQIYFFLCQLLH